MPDPPSEAVRRRVGALLAAVFLALAGTLLGLRLAGPTEDATGLGRASFDVRADLGGRVDAFVPIADWGIRADAFAAPFRLGFEVRTVNRPAALDAASGDSDVLRELEEELEGGARAAALRAAGWAIGCTAVLAGALYLARRRRPRAALVPLAGLAGAVGLCGVSLALAASTFDSEAFADPSFYGRGSELAQLLDFFESQGDERYASTFDGALTSFTAYLSDAPRPGEAESTGVLFGSDLHNNGLILPALARFAADRPVFLVGDFGHEGNEAEARAIVPRIAELGTEVVAVSGNHDSEEMMSALVAAGVTVLGADGPLDEEGRPSGEPILQVGNLTVAGFPDPLEWRGADPGDPDRIFSFAQMEDGEARYEDAQGELVAWFRRLPEEPDVVVVHQNGLAQHLGATLNEDGYDRPLTIVTGHNHAQRVDRLGSVTILNAGTLGAGGYLKVAQESVGLGQMYLGGEPPAVQSVDLITVEPVSGQAQADRVVLDVVCPADDELCSYEPEGS